MVLEEYKCDGQGPCQEFTRVFSWDAASVQGWVVLRLQYQDAGCREIDRTKHFCPNHAGKVKDTFWNLNAS